MRKFFRMLTPKQWILRGSVLLALLLAFLLMGIHKKNVNELLDQNVARTWGKVSDVTQISMFIPQKAGFNYMNVREFEDQLSKALKQASIVAEEESENGLLWLDAYSAVTNASFEGTAGKAEGVDLLAVGGDFFTFHPLEIISGRYFSSEDMMQDYIILDQDLAWKLFGSYDIVGQKVWMGNTPLVVCGVIRRPEGKMDKAAGNDKALAYVSYLYWMNTYAKESDPDGLPISTYELLTPNPVKGFGYNMFVNDTMKPEAYQAITVENTSRFELLPLLKVIRAFGTRSMGKNDIIFPYWENLARGKEDVLSLLLIFRLVLLLYAIVVILVIFIRYLKSLPWSQWKATLADKYDTFSCNWHAKTARRKKEDL